MGPVAEQTAACPHPQAIGNNFCPVCGTAVRAAINATDVFHQKISAIAAEHSGLDVVDYDDEGDGEPRALVGVSVAESDYHSSNSVELPDLRVLEALLADTFARHSLRVSREIRLFTMLDAG